jgi:hypothetical protein
MAEMDILQDLLLPGGPSIEDAPGALDVLDAPAPQEGALSMLDQPIPGQSLTQNPETPMAYETPPEFNSVDDAAHSVFMAMTQGDSYRKVMQMLDSGVPATIIAQSIVMFGASEGKWNMDMAVLLMEPVSLMVAGLGRDAGINVVISPPKKEPEDLDTVALSRMFKEKINKKKEPAEKQEDALDQAKSMMTRPEKETA